MTRMSLAEGVARGEVEVVPAECAEGDPAGAGDDGQLEEQGQSCVDLLGLGQELDHVDVGRRFDLVFDDLAWLGVIGGVAANPAPLHRLADRGSHDGVDPVHARGRQGRAVPARLDITRRPVRARGLVRTRRPLALLAPAARTVLGARGERAGRCVQAPPQAASSA